MQQIRNRSIVQYIGEEDNEHCGYCGKNTSSLFGLWGHSLTPEDFLSLLNRGWRRSGKYLYKPKLERTCCPQYCIRLDTLKFQISKSQKLVKKKMEKYLKEVQTTDDVNPLEITIVKPEFTNESYELYKKYQMIIHKESENDVSEKSYTNFLINSPLESDIKSITQGHPGLGTFHQHYRINGKLIAVAVLDILPTCISSVYFYYDPDLQHLSLGVFSVLNEIEMTLQFYKENPQLRYYYLGYYIHSCEKMKYKVQYKPSDLLDPVTYNWVPVSQCLPLLDKNKYTRFEVIENEELKENENDPSDVLLLMEPHLVHFRNFPMKELCKAEVDTYVKNVGDDLSKKMVLVF